MKAVQLVSVDDKDGTYQLNPEAVEVLRELESPCRVVSIAGRYRTGKSSLLNGLVRQEVFSTSTTVQAHTKGLVMYIPPEPGLVLIDTEGLGSVQVDARHDAAIFALSMVLSSGCFFNMLGTITSQTLQTLHLAGKVAHLLTTHTKLGLEMPPVIWVMRDFCLELQDQHGSPMSPSRYLEECLDRNPEVGSELKTMIPVRSAVTLPHPTGDNRQVHSLQETVPDFQKGLGHLRNLMRTFFPPKSRDGQLVHGTDLCRLVEALCTALNESETLPKMDSVWSAYLRECKREALQDTVQKLDPTEPLKVRLVQAIDMFHTKLSPDCIDAASVVELVTTVCNQEADVPSIARVDPVAHQQLEEQLHEQQQEQEVYQKRIEALVRSELSLRQEREDLIVTNGAQASQIQSLQEDLDSGIQTIRTEYVDLQALLESTEQVKLEYQNRASQAEERVAQLTKRQRAQTLTCTNLQTQLHTVQKQFQSTVQEVQMWKCRYEDVHQRYGKRQKYDDDSKLELIQSRAELTYLREAKETYERNIRALQAENLVLQRKNQKMTVLTSLQTTPSSHAKNQASVYTASQLNA